MSGDAHLLRDLHTLDVLTARRADAATRLRRELGAPVAHTLVARLAAAIGPARAHG